MNIEEKRKIFQSHLQNHHKTREEVIERKKAEQSLKNNPAEDMLFIQKEFRTRSQGIDQAIKKYKLKEVSFNELQSQYLSLKEYIVQISYVLTTYDRQFYKEALDKIQHTLVELKKKHEPKTKFKFSRRDGDFGVKGQIKIELEGKAKEGKGVDMPGLVAKKDEKLIIKEGWTTVGSYKIMDSESCSIDLLQKTEILFLKNLKNCTIRAACTKSTVFVDNCQNCFFQLSCHQLRIHNTVSSTFGIFVTSKAIIQDCKNIIFKPYKFEYEGRKSDEVEFEREGKENLWREIQDFNWLKQNMKSPHYELVEE